MPSRDPLPRTAVGFFNLMIKCLKCGVTKDKKEFGKNKRGRDGLKSYCKPCCKEYLAKWQKSNPKKANEYGYKWKNANPEKFKGYVRKHKENYKNWEINNPIQAKQNRQRYKDNNKDKMMEYDRNYKNSKYKNDDLFKLKCIIASRIRAYLKGIAKSKSTIEYLGCEIEFYKEYLTKQFSKDMSWENYGEYWEIDHIHPVSKGGSFHYSNTQPLTVTENREKGAKW